MKISHIIALVVIAVAIGIIMTLSSDASTYVSFKEADEMLKNGETKSIHVVGSLKKDANGRPVGMIYEPTIDPNHFEFMLIDSLKNERKVVYNQPKPADLDKSEKVVVVGKMQAEGYFSAEQILLKCPSKYNNQVEPK
jgi:cytochrome c-type biogenesis protein CcmE